MTYYTVLSSALLGPIQTTSKTDAYTMARALFIDRQVQVTIYQTRTLDGKLMGTEKLMEYGTIK